MSTSLQGTHTPSCRPGLEGAWVGTTRFSADMLLFMTGIVHRDDSQAKPKDASALLITRWEILLNNDLLHNTYLTCATPRMTHHTRACKKNYRSGRSFPSVFDMSHSVAARETLTRCLHTMQPTSARAVPSEVRAACSQIPGCSPRYVRHSPNCQQRKFFSFPQSNLETNVNPTNPH